MKNHIHGLAYVLGDNIDTDMIIPAQYLTLSHGNPEQKRELGRYAMAGMSPGVKPFVEDGEYTSKYSIIIAGDNFGCGSSRAQAPGSLNAAGVEVVIANYFARIFYRNSINAGLLIPAEIEQRICDEVSTGDEIDISFTDNKLVNGTTGKEYILKDLGAIKDILTAGDVFEYAKKAFA